MKKNTSFKFYVDVDVVDDVGGDHDDNLHLHGNGVPLRENLTEVASSQNIPEHLEYLRDINSGWLLILLYLRCQ